VLTAVVKRARSRVAASRIRATASASRKFLSFKE